MDTLAETLNVKLARWQPDVAELARQFIVEIIDLADQDALDILRSRFCKVRKGDRQDRLAILKILFLLN